MRALAGGFIRPRRDARADRRARRRAVPSFNVDLAQTSVSGLSSGAFMAGQFHVAFSATVIGAGIVAGGPYGCAEGQLATALNRCMQTHGGPPDAAHLLRARRGACAGGRDRSARGPRGRSGLRVLGHRGPHRHPGRGRSDRGVLSRAGVAEADIAYVADLAAGHAFVTESHGSACPTTASPYINDCDYDQAGALLAHIYGELNPPSAEPAGSIIAFDQSAFLADPTAHGLDPTGHVYVPPSCAQGATCRVHIAFHGCQQTDALIGDRFRTETGYDRWADTNDLIVLYPQAHRDVPEPERLLGLVGLRRRPARDQERPPDGRGARHARPAAGIDPFCEAHATSNLEHWQAGRAEVCNFWLLCAAGSGDPIGYLFGAATLYERPQGTSAPRAAPPLSTRLQTPRLSFAARRAHLTPPPPVALGNPRLTVPRTRLCYMAAKPSDGN